ncbi:hypothetical protein ACWDUC_22810 [Streptomyces tricolor]
MTTRQTTEATSSPIADTLDTPTLSRAETPQGCSQAESSRTADREGRTTPTRTTPPQVSAVLDLSAQGSSIMTRDTVPVPVPQQPAAGAGLTAAIGQGGVQGAVRSITDRLVDKFLTNPPDWLKVLWHALPKPWE